MYRFLSIAVGATLMSGSAWAVTISSHSCNFQPTAARPPGATAATGVA